MMIYFDNSATTKPHDEVLQTFVEVNKNYYANPASIHAFGVEVNELLEAARNQIATYSKQSRNMFYSLPVEQNQTTLQFLVLQRQTSISENI